MFSWAVSSTILGNGLEQWLKAAMILAVGWLLGKLISLLGASIFRKLAARTENRMDDELVQTMRQPLVTLITVLSFVLGYQQLEVPEHIDKWMERVFHVAVALAVTWAIVRALDTLVGAMLRNRSERNEDKDSAQFIPVVRSSFKALLWGLGVVVALNNAGYDVGALLAGIGIGGLALAMAAKDTLANIFGGITVFTDKPFRVGDRVRLNGYDGIVEEVGIRSTRIRTMDGPLVVVPNNKFADSILENVSQEASRRVRHDLGLVYSTTNAQIEEALGILHALVKDHGSDLEVDHAAYFSAFKDSSLNLVFVYHIRKGSEIFNVQTRVHLDLLERFRKAGLEFAYPTSVQYAIDVKS
ncbi:MAG: mechanosensitive ion channel family protein [Flavobacteriales bacterium]|nr:mechanosensitive ion channel family protein [Flavobacteriales bacterium]